MEEFDLRKNNEQFIRKIKEKDPTYFDKLKKGQAPEFFVLACSDSRVSPTVITEMGLGQMFVHRNIANQVVNEDESFSASLYYALKHLKVKTIIIKGHTDCGGIKAAKDGNEIKELQGWITNIRKSLPNSMDNLTLNDMAKMNVMKQVDRLKQHPIYKQYGQNVEVRGCLFHVESGELERII